MLSTKTGRRSAGRRPSNRTARRRRFAHARADRAADSAASVKSKRDETTNGSAGPAGGKRSIRIRKDETLKEPKAVAGAPADARSDSKRRALDSAAQSDGDPDGRLQLTLDLSDPEPRGYEASGKPPSERIDTTRWLWLAMGMGAATCPILLGFQLVFTNPAHGLNVIAVVVTMSFGALFATWTFEYWLRRGTAADAAKPPIWALTRHSVLASVGVAAMAVSALNGTASFGLLILVVFTLIVADIVLRRLRIR